MVLLTMLVLAFLARTVTMTAARRGFDSLNYVNAARATLTADAATQFVIDELSRDPEFETDINNQAITTMEGQFSVNFVTAGTNAVGPLESVNNLKGTNTVNGPRGDDTVPPGVLDLVVVVEVAGEQKVFETLIRSPQALALQPAIGAAGNIRLRGDVTVDGIESTSTNNPVDGGLHSSEAGATAQDVITYVQNDPTDSALVTGKVTTSSASSLAIDMGVATVDGGIETGQAGAAVTDPRIVDTVASKAGATGFSPPGFGDAALTPGEHYASGTVTVQGDLQLDGSDLYVNGDLEVNGSIYGDGSVWVTGETHFRGDAAIRTNEQSVSLLSHGNVHLEGFGGLDYLDSFVANSGDPVLVKTLDDTRAAMDGLAAILAVSSPADLDHSGSADDGTQSFRRALADPTPYTDPDDNPAPAGSELDTLTTLATALSAQPSGPTRDFMVERLGSLQRFMRDNDNSPATMIQDLAEWQAGDLSGDGYWDSIAEYQNFTGLTIPAGTFEQLYNWGENMTFDKLGTSSFQGTVHTDAGFLGENEVAVIGQIQATGKNLGAATLTSAQGEDVEAGDVVLSNGSHITYCQEYVDKSQALSGGGEWAVDVWIER